ncbi:MAG: butyrate kinase [Prevotellaceae bacterium]|nr:butyrate kinase [Prevotellaceae bacterium]
MKKYKILVINPGSTSTKIAVFEDETVVFSENIKHSAEELSRFGHIIYQHKFRKDLILHKLEEAKIDIANIDIIVGRGGLVKPILSGAYEVNERLKEDLFNCVQGEHASNLGGLIADDIAKLTLHAQAYIADPVVVDELQDVARITGHPKIYRKSIFHALNQKSVARKFAKSLNLKYEDLNLIIAHLGGGISIGAHQRGKVIDVNNGLDGEGPFSPERAGSLPTGALVKLCFSNKYSYEEVKKMLVGNGGLIALMGTNEAKDIEIMAEKGDARAKLVQDAMCYQIGKYIGALATVLKGKVDGIIITGGIAYNKYLCDYVREMVKFIAPINIYPGEGEMAALAINGLMILNGELKPLIYE